MPQEMNNPPARMGQIPTVQVGNERSKTPLQSGTHTSPQASIGVLKTTDRRDMARSGNSPVATMCSSSSSSSSSSSFYSVMEGKARKTPDPSLDFMENN